MHPRIVAHRSLIVVLTGVLAIACVTPPNAEPPSATEAPAANGSPSSAALEGLAAVGGMQLPAVRTWTVNADGRLLGVDTIFDARTL